MTLTRLTETAADTDSVYADISWPDAPTGRPYVYVNMASTADGKIVIGTAHGSAKGVGGATDQLLFRRLQLQADAVIVGAVTLRASQVIYPSQKPRFTVTRSGDIPTSNRFFTDAPDKAHIFVPGSLDEHVCSRLAAETGAAVLPCGTTDVDIPRALGIIRNQFGAKSLLCEGGSVLNEQLFRLGLVDELFLTLAPRIKGGAHLPTPVGGAGFEPGKYASLQLLSVYRDEDELYLRYRVVPQQSEGTQQ